jgi:hypothetical protein
MEYDKETLYYCQGCSRIWDPAETVPEKPDKHCPDCHVPCAEYGADYVDQCPHGCDPIKLTSFKASCSIAVQHDGWALVDGPCDTSDEAFHCDEHGRVPPEWVFGRMTRKAALAKMAMWRKKNQGVSR